MVSRNENISFPKIHHQLMDDNRINVNIRLLSTPCCLI